jgi:EF hand
MRKNTLAVVISSLLMAAATQAQPAEPTDSSATTPSASQSQTTGSSTTLETGTTTTTTGTGTTTTTESPSTQSAGQDSGTYSQGSQDQSSYEADQSNSSDAAAMAQQRWSAADTDRNGTLSQAEMQVSMPTIATNFTQMDANGDGQLSQDEMHSFKRAEGKGQWHKEFKTADADRDGALTLAEAQSGMPMMASQFSTIDTDKDGKVTTNELAVHHASMHGTSSMDADTSTRTSTTTSTTTTETDTDKPDDSSSQ